MASLGCVVEALEIIRGIGGTQPGDRVISPGELKDVIVLHDLIPDKPWGDPPLPLHYSVTGIRTASDVSERINGLRDLTAYGLEYLHEAMEEAWRIRNTQLRANALHALVPRLQELACAAKQVKLTRSVGNSESKARALDALTPRLAELSGTTADTLAAARAIRVTEDRALL